MQIIKKNARNLTERFIGSSFAQKSVMAAIALVISTSNLFALAKLYGISVEELLKEVE